MRWLPLVIFKRIQCVKSCIFLHFSFAKWDRYKKLRQNNCFAAHHHTHTIFVYHYSRCQPVPSAVEIQNLTSQHTSGCDTILGPRSEQ